MNASSSKPTHPSSRNISLPDVVAPVAINSDSPVRREATVLFTPPSVSDSAQLPGPLGSECSWETIVDDSEVFDVAGSWETVDEAGALAHVAIPRGHPRDLDENDSDSGTWDTVGSTVEATSIGSPDSPWEGEEDELSSGSSSDFALSSSDSLSTTDTPIPNISTHESLSDTPDPAIDQLLGGRLGTIADLADFQDVEDEDANYIVPGFAENFRLLPHQVLGRLWMRRQEEGGIPGGILADVMGLGKTIQIIVLIMDDRYKSRDSARPTLVICPVAVMDQWVMEITTKAKGLRVVQHRGPHRTIDPSDFHQADVVLTSYQTTSTEYSGKRGGDPQALPTVRRNALFQFQWRRVVLDEAHTIKDHKTKTAKACFAIDADFRWCLTGTPIQNGIKELYSYTKFLRLARWDDWDVFQEEVILPLKDGEAKRAWKTIHVLLCAIMLRRNKDVLALPERTVHTEVCQFTASEREAYDELETELREDVMDALASGKFSSLLVSLLRLRQACCHVTIARGNFDAGAILDSPKTRKMLQILDMIKERPGPPQKTIIFSQFLPMLDLVQVNLEAQGIAYVRYDGNMNKAEQQLSLRLIKNDPTIQCILISFKAGSLGLNLTACTNVILMDPWWNPALEEQAFDRVHRVGQTQAVHIYKVVVEQTVEDRVLKLQDKKRKIIQNALGSDIQDLRSMRKEDLMSLFSART